ncbi:MAG: DnaA/Hda family protein [Dehalococcoidia bacterium]
MDRDAGVLWQDALRHLAQHVSRPNFATWLEGTEGLRADDDALIVGTRSEFVTEWLQKRLRPLIVRTITDLAGEPLDVRFEPLRAVIDTSPARRTQASTEEHVSPARPRLRERYTFDTFVVGPGNRLASAAAHGVARSPGTLYNPLFLYGEAGLGKTHLLHAIGHECVGKGLSVLYTSAEQFTNQLITAIQQRTTDEFRQRYRSVDVLLIDDIQFIAGKEQTQTEFFHTFNDLHQSQRQLVITSDKSPALIPNLEDRLRTRF